MSYSELVQFLGTTNNRIKLPGEYYLPAGTRGSGVFRQRFLEVL